VILDHLETGDAARGDHRSLGIEARAVFIVCRSLGGRCCLAGLRRDWVAVHGVVLQWAGCFSIGHWIHPLN
jgi:hypothetical protein